MIGRHASHATWRRAAHRLPFVLSLLALAVVGASAPARSADSLGLAKDGSFTATEELTRAHLVDGVDRVVDKRQFSLSVSETRQLRDRQEITVSWTGAHPTGGVVGDHNSADAAQQEYPVMLVECRGTDDPNAPAASRVSPTTCFTHTPAERFQSDLAFAFPAFRLDRYADAADRAVSVGQPSPLPAACANQAGGVQHWIPFDAVDGKRYGGGSLGCAGLPPEAVNVEQQLQPSNTAYGVTASDGTGSEKFVIATDETNASLGCSRAVACTLEAIPIEGISCDPAASGLPESDRPAEGVEADQALSECSAVGHYQPGEVNPGVQNQEDKAVSGVLWWSPSNWRNRINVPLSFAPASNICSIENTAPPTFVYGSELMVQATQQWAPAFCLDKTRFPVQQVQTGEPQAKSLLNSGSIQAAFAAAPPPNGFTRPIVQAPAAMTGFAVAFDVDDVHGRAVHTLRLTPRLLAKLLSQSYASNGGVRGLYEALSKNPLDLASDPEMRALNPDMPVLGYDHEPASTLFALSSESDIMSALSSYINADPEARAFLDGKPDPWGMVVNPNYKGIALPVQSWPQLDPFIYKPADNGCFAESPVPWLGQVAAPVSTLAALTLNLQFGLANSQVKCVNSGQLNQKLTGLGRQDPGRRFIVGITSLAAAARYQLDTASLQTAVAANAPAKPTNADGRTFVAPGIDTLRAAARLLTPNAKAGTWLIDPAAFRSSAAAKNAYPGAMLVSLDVPTSGLSATDARHYGELLTSVAGPLQVAGSGNGQLPDGYLPLTAAYGLGTQAAYTKAVAVAVTKQSGTVPSLLSPVVSAPTPSAAPPPVRVTVAPQPTRASSQGVVVPPPAPAVTTRSTVTPPPAPQVMPTARPTELVVPAAATGATPVLSTGRAGLVLPVLLGLLALSTVLALTVLNLPARRPT